MTTTHTSHQPSNTVIGRISTTRKGAGYIDDPDPLKDSIYIEEGNLNTALNGDTVEVRFAPKMIRGVKQPVGEVLQIIERAKDFYVGIVDISNGKPIVIPDDKKMYTTFTLTEGDTTNLKKDDKVYVEMLSWTDPKQNPTAKLIRVLGKKGVNNVEMESIVLEKGFEVGFPKAVEKEAEEIEKNERTISAEEIAKRRDMRGTETFTIDPFDAKDFDDAISFKKITTGAHAGYYEIGVHIADVSHYVREGSALDKEAVKRGCSVYLVDRTIPMLPEVLSNDVCSLNPHEDKLSFSAIFVIDSKGHIHERWFGRTVMNSTHRFTYETAQAVIDGEPKNVEKYSKGIQVTASVEPGMPYREQLITLNNIAKILQKEKFSRGAIEFETQEIKFKLDKDGKPIGVYAYERIDTHKLVEEYMLLANREVAKFVFDQIKKKGKRDTGAIYRIHDAPDKDKIKNLALFVKALGFDLRADKDGVVTAHNLNDLLEQIDGKPQENLIRTAILRSMQKAVYSTKNVGHFGLAFEFYTHFTSPIRRYPDLLVHRVLAKHLHNEPFGDKDIVAFQHIADSSTRREISASEAERESKKLKQVEYMSTRLGIVFEGTITGVTKWGMYVEENESKSEGMIGMRSLGIDYYVFNEKSYSIIGEKTGKVFTLGDKVKFKAIAADLDKKTLDYVLVA
ncbi:MAG TPA: ribonuclease R [Candidatus Paceibacterota bacterium]|nr:ribonuclease R [Candidatus Paceibacterota bacterium]